MSNPRISSVDKKNVLRFTIALSVGAALWLGYSQRDRLLPPASSSQEMENPAPSSQEKFETALALGWDAAVMVQNPPHSTDTWQTAKVKWRQAIRLLEAIPPKAAIAAEAKRRIPIYRRNFDAISQRLEAEKTAADKLKTAQSIAWQAAVIVQNPPHPLRIWERANTKWQEAIALLEPIPNTTSVAAHSQAKLATYRTNQAEINQRISLETKAQQLLQQFRTVSTHLQGLSTSIASGLTIEQIGITYPDYVNVMQSLETSLNQFATQPNAVNHPIYAELAAAIEDYKFALKLWNVYLGYKQANSQWLYDDLFNQLVPIAWFDSATLFQKYEVKTFSNGTKVSLRYSVWEIWKHAAIRVSQAEAAIDRLD